MSILTNDLTDNISSFNTRLGTTRSRQDSASGVPINNLSVVRGETSSELKFSTIPQLLSDTVSKYGPREAMVFVETGKRLTYYDFDKEVDALAAGFLSLGLVKGDRVGIWSPNKYEWVLTQFATARIGLILVNINPAYRLSEVEYALNKVGCKVLILADKFKTSNYTGMIQELAPELENCQLGRLVAARLPHLRHVVVIGDVAPIGMYCFDDLKQLGGPAQILRLAAVDATLDPDDPINIQFTSGTTGTPKGATLSHYNIVNNARFVTDRIKLGEGDRMAIPVPLYHCFGMVMGVLGCVSKGATMVFPAETFAPDSTLAALSDEQCTVCYGVPTMFVAMLQALQGSQYNLSNMRTGIMAGAPCPVDVMERVNTEMHMEEVTICYGMTETSPVSFQSFVDDPIIKRCQTVGKVHPHLEVKLVDEQGAIVPVGQKGELCTRGYSVMKRYWEDIDKTNDCIVDGWMRTGDLATFDEQGFCSIVGRVKDMIIRGGENIYPREIEEYLFKHQAILEVQVFGIPHEKYGEEVACWAVLKPDASLTEDEVKNYCQGQIAHYKIPKYIHFVEVIPMTVTGKPQKFVMRDEMIKILAK